MITRTVNSYLRGFKLWQHCTLTCRLAFIREMRGKEYGIDECRQAFWWFVKGWRDADLQRLSDSCSQVNTENRSANDLY
jgi:hypothetical protein